jgi:outer membrane protein assembly factor BamB
MPKTMTPRVLLLAFVLACNDSTPPRSNSPAWLVWRVPGATQGGIPAVDETQAYFPILPDTVIAVNRADGRIAWRAHAPGAPSFLTSSSLVVAGETVMFGDRYIYAFDRATGTPRWIFVSADADDPGGRRLATDGQVVYAASVDKGRVYAIDVATGLARWFERMPCDVPDADLSATDPLIADGVVYVPFTSGFAPCGGIAAFDAVTGALRWHRVLRPFYEPGVYGSNRAPALVGGRLVTSTYSGSVYALNPATGDSLWAAPPVHPGPDQPGGGYGDQRSIVASGSFAIVTSGTGILLALDPVTGQERWRRQFSQSSHRTITSDAEHVYIRSHGNKLVCVRASDGAIVWERGGSEEPNAPLDTYFFTGRVTVRDTVIYSTSRDFVFAASIR